MKSYIKICYKNEFSAKIQSSYQRNKIITSSPKTFLREKTPTPVQFRQESVLQCKWAVVLVGHEALTAEIHKLTIWEEKMKDRDGNPSAKALSDQENAVVAHTHALKPLTDHHAG